MIIVRAPAGEQSNEIDASNLLKKIALDGIKDLEKNNDVQIEIIPSLRCFGEETQDIDVVICFIDKRKEPVFKNSKGNPIRAFLLAVEVKGHSPDQGIRFEGGRVFVTYKEGWEKSATEQSDKQKFSLQSYLNKITGIKPYVNNLIFLNNFQKKLIPSEPSNIIASNSTWDDIINLIYWSYSEIEPETFNNFVNALTKKIEFTELDRRKFEFITKKQIDFSNQDYAKKLGKQLLIYRGRGGTGKTIRLLQTGYQLYDEKGLKVILLTFNRTLVSDIKRTLFHLKINTKYDSVSGFEIQGLDQFFYKWIKAFTELVDKHFNHKYFLKNYEIHKEELLTYIKDGALNEKDIEKIKTEHGLDFDYVLVDESQDTPENEKHLIYKLYGYENVIIADGVDQFVKAERTNWREGITKDQNQIISLKNQSQIISLTKSLRLKQKLCKSSMFFAEKIAYDQWNIQPQDEMYGGKVKIVFGDIFSKNNFEENGFHFNLWKELEESGHKPIDTLSIVPNSLIIKKEAYESSKIGDLYTNNGKKVWGSCQKVKEVNNEKFVSQTRKNFPTNPDEFRIVNYRSCRGLEGWFTINYCFDELYEDVLKFPEIPTSTKDNLFYDHKSEAEKSAKQWLMIPFTRAIDTLYLHISNPNSYIGKCLNELIKEYPDYFEKIEIKNNQKKIFH